MNTIQKAQARLLEMSLSIKKVLEENSIPYYIAYGTLLGAVRHKGFIPWDDDFDICLFDDTYDEAIEILRKNLPCDYFIEDATSEPKYFHGWAHIKDLKTITECALYPENDIYTHKGLCIDLFRMYTVKEKEIPSFMINHLNKFYNRKIRAGLMTQKEAQDLMNNLSKRRYDFNHFDKSSEKLMITSPLGIVDTFEPDDIYPLKKYEFEGYHFYGPSNFHKLLTANFGNYMELPPIENRKPHYSDVKFIN